MQAILAGQFAIEVTSFAVMGNHIHQLMTNRPDVAQTWSKEEVVRRWLRISKLKISGGDLAMEPSEAQVKTELAKGGKRIRRLRRRLSDFSWYMGALCENISRRINREEGRGGTCWEGRYKCRVAQSDEEALTMSLYVDLNPLRSGIVDRIEGCTLSSIGLRLQAEEARRRGIAFAIENFRSGAWLGALYLDERRPVDDPMYFRSATGQRASDRGLFWFPDSDYYRVVDALARERHPDKRGVTPAELAPVLERLGWTMEELLSAVDSYGP